MFLKIHLSQRDVSFTNGEELTSHVLGTTLEREVHQKSKP